MKQKSPVVYIVGAILLYLVSTGISYAAFSLLAPVVKTTPVPLPSSTKGQFVIDPTLPRTEECVLNGDMFPKSFRYIWEKRRPLAVMIENHEDSRPQSGLSFADVVYETVAEGGITRFMGLFYCKSAPFDIGLSPVRSARTYFLDWVSEYDALYNHVGGAGRCNDDTVDERAKALCQIDKYGIKDLDQFGIPFPICYRNYDRLTHPVATEHTMVCFTDKLHELAKKRGWTNIDEEGIPWDENFVPWKFKEDAKESERGAVSSLSFAHWEQMADKYSVQWNYDSQSNSYKRLTGSQEHLDLETNAQLTAKAIVIQFTKETDGVDEHAHILYANIGGGKALIFQDGKAIVGTWKKPKRISRTQFFDEKGKEISFVRGPIWIEVIATDTKVTY